MSGSKLITELGARIGISDLALDEEHINNLTQVNKGLHNWYK